MKYTITILLSVLLIIHASASSMISSDEDPIVFKCEKGSKVQELYLYQDSTFILKNFPREREIRDGKWRIIASDTIMLKFREQTVSESLSMSSISEMKLQVWDSNTLIAHRFPFLDDRKVYFKRDTINKVNIISEGLFIYEDTKSNINSCGQKENTVSCPVKQNLFNDSLLNKWNQATLDNLNAQMKDIKEIGNEDEMDFAMYLQENNEYYYQEIINQTYNGFDYISNIRRQLFETLNTDVYFIRASNNIKYKQEEYDKDPTLYSGIAEEYIALLNDLDFYVIEQMSGPHTSSFVLFPKNIYQLSYSYYSLDRKGWSSVKIDLPLEWILEERRNIDLLEFAQYYNDIAAKTQPNDEISFSSSLTKIIITQFAKDSITSHFYSSSYNISLEEYGKFWEMSHN